MRLSIPVLLLSAVCALAADPILPDPRLSPGDALTNVTVEQVTTRGYANVLNGGARDVPESEKRAVFVEYFGAVPAHPGNYEIDHIISLELRGSNDIKNLFPEAFTNLVTNVISGHIIVTDWGAHTKDRLEDRMAAMLRADLKANGHDHAMALMKQFQREISANWTNAYAKYFPK